MFIFGADVDKSAVDLATEEPPNAPLEIGEMDRQPSMKILPKQEGDKSSPPSYFGRWFELVPPEKTIQEDEYFWHTGQALEPDFWTSEDKLDDYLGLNDPSVPEWTTSEDEEAGSFPPFLSLDLNFDNESVSSEFDAEIIREDFERESSVSSDWSLYTMSVEEASLDLPSYQKQMSDWDVMPPLWPKLENSAAEPMQREQSDWTKMPAILPPLNKPADLEAIPIERSATDWSNMPTLMPPLMQPFTSDPSDWVAIEDVVPKSLPQASWESDFSNEEVHSPPQWLRNADSSNAPYGSNEDPMVARQIGLEQTREMEFLSSEESSNQPLPPTYAPVVYQYGYQPAMGTIAFNPAPAVFHPQTSALVHIPLFGLAASII